MPNIDQFESVFRSAARTVFHYAPVSIGRAMVVTDLDGGAAQAFADRARALLSGPGGPTPLVLDVPAAAEVATIGALLERVKASAPDVVVTYRNVHSGAYQWPYTLGDHVEVLTQVTDVPVLLLPRPGDSGAPPVNTDVVMAVTDHLTGDDRLVRYAAALTQPDGTLFLAHVEDAATFERYMGAIGRIAELDTDTARTRLRARLLKEPADFIESARQVLHAAGVALKIEPEVQIGHPLSVYRELVVEHGVDLLVLNTKDDEQLAMHGLAYPLAVELRHVAMLLL